MVQDRLGFLWIGTQDGLNRFDGKEFEHYSKVGNSPTILLNNHIKEIKIENDSLWVASAMGGVNIINIKNGNVISAMTPASHPGLNHWIETILPGKNEVWMGSWEGLVCYNKTTRKYQSWVQNPFQQQADYAIKKIAYAGNDLIIGGVDDNGLVIYSRSRKQLVKKVAMLQVFPPSLSDLNFNSVTVFGDTLLCATKQGAFMFRINFASLILQPLPLDATLSDSRLNVSSVEKLKNCWLVTTSAGLFVYSNTWQFVNHYTTANSQLSDDQLAGSYIDRQQNIWLTTYSGIEKISTKNEWFQKMNVDTINRTRLSNLSTLFSASPQLLVAASWNDLFVVHTNTHTISKASGAGHSQVFYNSYKCKDDKLIVSGLNGNYYLNTNDSKKGLIPFSEPDGLTGLPKKFTFSTALQYNDTTVFFGAEYNVGIFVGGKHRHLLSTMPSSLIKLSENSVNKLYKDSKNKIWCLHDNSIDIIDWQEKKSMTIKPGKLPASPDGAVFFDVVESNGCIWLATYGSGIYYLPHNSATWKVLNTNNGLCNNSVYTLTIENDSIIWASTNIGLSRINTKSLLVNNFYSSNDKSPVNFDERGAVKHNGKIYFAGPDGLILFSPDLYHPANDTPRAWIKMLTYYLNGNSYRLSDMENAETVLPYNAYNIEIKFSAIDFSEPELNQFYYRFINKGPEWNSIGYNHSILLSEMPVGENLLEAKAKNNIGNWSYNVCRIKITVEPPWYQTHWFKILLAGIGLSIVYALYHYRINQLKREEAIRTRIAADLHDEIGSTLTGVRMFADLGLAQNSTAYFPQIKQGLQDASGSLRDIIWVLDKANNNAQQLLERIDKFTRPLARAAQINFQIYQEEGLGSVELNLEMRRDFYLIMKEFVTNSFKYAQCSNLTITARKQGKHLYILLRDDGIGFNPKIIVRGNGLTNMLKRAQKASYTASLHSQLGSGTSLELLP